MSAAVALMLGTCVYPALAATSTDARSDRPIYAAPMSLSAEHQLPMPVIDHGAANAAPPEALPLDDSMSEAAPDAAQTPTGPQVDVLLQRMLDEAQARQPKLQRPQQHDDFIAPLAVDKSETLEDPPGVLQPDRTDAAAEILGFGADELLRYRREMYRTDI